MSLVRAVYNRMFATTSSIWFRRPIEDEDRIVADVSASVDLTVKPLSDDKRLLIDWLLQHHEQFPWMYIPEEIEIAERDNHIFFAFFRSGSIVGYVKLGVDHTYIHDFKKVIRFPPGDCFVYDTFILPDHRGNSLAYHGLMKMMPHLAGCGLQRIWCHIEEWNVPSLKLFRRAGFEEVDRIRFSRVLGVPFFLRNRSLPFLSLERYLHRSTARRERPVPQV